MSLEHFEFRHFRPHYLDVNTIFGDLRRECLHQRVVRNTKILRWQPSCSYTKSQLLHFLQNSLLI